MYKIYFYRKENGENPVADYIKELASKNNKDSRIKLNKIQDYVKALRKYGLTLGEPYLKHLDGDIWELRPLRNRILFAKWDEQNQGFVLLHCFMKQTQKTPKREIEQAKKNLYDYQKRSESNEKK